MGTRADRTSLGRESKKGGGWGARDDQQYQCPECGKRCCGAKISAAQLAKSQEQGLRARCKTLTCHRAAGWSTNHSGWGNCKFHRGNTESHQKSAARQETRALMRTYGVPVDIDPEDALREEIHRTVGHVRWLAEKVASLGEDEVLAEVNGSSEPRAAKVIDMKPTRHPNSRAREQDDEDDDEAGEPYTEDVSRDVVRLAPTGDEALVFGVAEREVQAGGEGGGHDRVKLTAQPNVWLQVYMAERKHLADITKIAMAAGLESRRLDWAEGMADRLISAMEDLASELGLDPTAPSVRLQIAASLERLTDRASA